MLAKLINYLLIYQDIKKKNVYIDISIQQLVLQLEKYINKKKKKTININKQNKKNKDPLDVKIVEDDYREQLEELEKEEPLYQEYIKDDKHIIKQKLLNDSIYIVEDVNAPKINKGEEPKIELPKENKTKDYGDCEISIIHNNELPNLNELAAPELTTPNPLKGSVCILDDIDHIPVIKSEVLNTKEISKYNGKIIEVRDSPCESVNGFYKVTGGYTQKLDKYGKTKTQRRRLREKGIKPQ